MEITSEELVALLEKLYGPMSPVESTSIDDWFRWLDEKFPRKTYPPYAEAPVKQVLRRRRAR